MHSFFQRDSGSFRRMKSVRIPLPLWLVIAVALIVNLQAAKRPNFVFVISEDNSIHYSSLYGNKVAAMPAIEKLASQGLIFDHAFSCSPVCSVARSTLATGMYAPRGGFQYHRKSEPATLPKGLKPWSQILKEAGYYTANNAKTDYNFVHNIKELWNESSRKASWRNRPDGAPFFYMQSFSTSHEGQLHFSEKTMATEKLNTAKKDVAIAPYHPDTPTFRHTYARYHDKIKAVDAQIGNVVKQLEADGLLEDTFIFYFGDHGGVLPRGKGYAYESGLHVPLVVRIPKNFKDLVDFSPGRRVNGFVEFVDLGPTVLKLAGIKAPKLMDGSAFLGQGVSAKEVNSRDEAFGHADRFDEKYDLVRTLRVGRFMYHRNFQGYYPDSLQNNYRYRMLAYEEWRTLWKAGKLNAAQSQFFERRSAEQLFDIEADPHQVKDLAKDPKYAATVKQLRARLSERMREINDLSIFPESEQVQNILSNPLGYGNQNSRTVARCLAIADLALEPAFDKVRDRMKRAMNSKNDWERYWALMTCATIGRAAKPLANEAKKRLKDENLMVRLRAAEFLGIIGSIDPRETLYSIITESGSNDEVLLAFNGIVMFKDFEPSFEFDVKRLTAVKRGGQVPRRYEYFGVKPAPKPKQKRKARK